MYKFAHFVLAICNKSFSVLYKLTEKCYTIAH